MLITEVMHLHNEYTYVTTVVHTYACTDAYMHTRIYIHHSKPLYTKSEQTYNNIVPMARNVKVGPVLQIISSAVGEYLGYIGSLFPSTCAQSNQLNKGEEETGLTQ